MRLKKGEMMRLRYIALALVGLSLGLTCFWILSGAKRAHLHFGCFRLFLEPAGNAHCNVDMRGFLGFYVLVIGNSEQTSDLADWKANLVIRFGTNDPVTVPLNKLSRDGANAPPFLKGQLSRFSSDFIGMQGDQTVRSAVEFDYIGETNAFPFEIWIKYVVPGTRVEAEDHYMFLDKTAESQRITRERVAH